jgi:hypothetical protein
MTMDLIRNTQPLGARAWRYWARFWTLSAIAMAALVLGTLVSDPTRWMLWGTWLAWGLIAYGMAKLCWLVAERKAGRIER